MKKTTIIMLSFPRKRESTIIIPMVNKWWIPDQVRDDNK